MLDRDDGDEVAASTLSLRNSQLRLIFAERFPEGFLVILGESETAALANRAAVNTGEFVTLGSATTFWGVNEAASGYTGKPDDMSSDSIIQSSTKDITRKVIGIASDLKNEYPDDPNVAKTINEMKTTLLKGQNFCGKCLTVYAAGDKYCSVCGAKVIVYGACEKCGALKKGAYCASCGASGDEKKQ